jgi:hypothetical protein
VNVDDFVEGLGPFLSSRINAASPKGAPTATVNAIQNPSWRTTPMKNHFAQGLMVGIAWLVAIFGVYFARKL